MYIIKAFVYIIGFTAYINYMGFLFLFQECTNFHIYYSCEISIQPETCSSAAHKSAAVLLPGRSC